MVKLDLDLDPDPGLHSEKLLDPDPHKMNADPQPWLAVSELAEVCPTLRMALYGAQVQV